MTSKKKELFVDLNTIDPKEVEWLWEPFIPFSMITIMEGDPGVGKSFLAMQLAAQISIGGELPRGRSWIAVACYTSAPRMTRPTRSGRASMRWGATLRASACRAISCRSTRRD